MPDEPLQNKHAQAIQWERQLMNQLGVPRSEARRAITGDRRLANTVPNNQPAVQRGEQPAAQQGREMAPMVLAPRPFSLPAAPVNAPAPAPPGKVLDEVEITVFINGVIGVGKVATSTGFTEI